MDQTQLGNIWNELNEAMKQDDWRAADRLVDLVRQYRVGAGALPGDFKGTTEEFDNQLNAIANDIRAKAAAPRE